MVENVEDYLRVVQDTARRVFGDGDYDEEINPSLGVVTGEVIRATNLPVDAGGTCDSYVQVSAVEAGTGPLMFRCKTPIHSTDTVKANRNPDYTNSHFSFQTEEDLAGDLLFSAYERSSGHSRLIGQYSMPLLDLLDPAGKRSGKQTLLRLQPTLRAQQGDSTDAQIHISLQLILPPERQQEGQVGAKARALQRMVAVQRGQKDASKEEGGGGIRQKKSRSREDGISGGRRMESDRIARENERNKRRLQEVQQRRVKEAAKSRAQKAAPKRASSSFINRQRFLQRVARDNITHQRRIKSSTKSITRTMEEKNKQATALENKRKERSDREMQRRYRETSDLVREVASLQGQVADLRQDAQMQKQTLERLKSSVQREQRVIKSLTKMTKAQATTKSCGAVSGPRDTQSLIEDKRRDVALAHPRHGRKSKELLDAHRVAKETRRRIVARCQQVLQQCDQAQVETREVQERIAWAKTRRVWWRHQRNNMIPDGMSHAEVAEHEALDKVLSSLVSCVFVGASFCCVGRFSPKMTDLKVDIEAISLTVAQKGTSDSKYGSKAVQIDDAVDRLEGKIADKEQKLDALQATRAVWKHKQEDAIRADEAATLRRDIRELQHLLRMCDRERQRASKLKAESSQAVLEERRKFEETTADANAYA